MASLAEGVRFLPSAGGTADFVYSSTVVGYNNATSLLADGKTYRYRAESSDLSQWEWGSGVWTAGISTLARTTISWSSNANAKVNFISAPQVAIVIFPADILQFDDAMSLTAAQKEQARENIGIPAAVRSYLAGLALSNDGTTPTTVLDIAAGVCTDSTNTVSITLGAFTKSVSGAWAAGSGSNGMGTGLTVAPSTWYHVFAIINAGAADVYFDTSVSAANAPAGTTAFRRIGSIKTDGSSHILAFTQIGDQFFWSAITNDINTSTLSTTPTLFAVNVPLGLNVTAVLRGYFSHASANTLLLLSSPLETSVAANSVAGNFTAAVPVAAQAIAWRDNVVVNTSQQVRAVASAASSTLECVTVGWIDRRGRDA